MTLIEKQKESRLAIQTERLTIRDYKEDDWEDFLELTSQEQVAKFMHWHPTKAENKEAELEWIREQNGLSLNTLGRYLDFAVVLGDKVIGDVSIKRLSEDNKDADVGWFFSAHYWGKGYALEAGSAIIDYFFHAFDLNRVVTYCDERNTRSWQLMERLGMRREGRHLEVRYVKNEWINEYTYAILRKEWLAKPKPIYNVKMTSLQTAKETP
jgi:RimJ/RimL family protein N-acetyltransferase